MVHKAGATFQKKLSEYFDKENPSHLRAWAYQQESGHWPPGFLGNEVYEDSDWPEVIGNPFDGRTLPPEVTAWLARWRRIKSVIRGMSFYDYYFTVEPIDNDFYIKVHESGLAEDLRSRRWLLQPTDNLIAIVDVCIQAATEVIESVVRQDFRSRLLGLAIAKEELDERTNGS